MQVIKQGLRLGFIALLGLFPISFKNQNQDFAHSIGNIKEM